MLLRTSYGNRTSVVLRGAWVLDKLMGTPPTPPPPGVETNLDTPAGEQPKTVRARMELHRKNPTCAACHALMDPFGFALEPFDAVGQYRTLDGTSPIDDSVTMYDGKSQLLIKNPINRYLINSPMLLEM